MKKVLILATMLIFSSVAYAEGTVNQLQEAKDIKGAIVIKKQPTQEQAIQVQKAEKIYGSILIFVQGKCPVIEKETK